MTNTQQRARPLFTLGQVFMTPGAEAALAAADQSPFEFLARHLAGDWGEGLPPEDVQANQDALQQELRLLSRYITKQNEVIWVITEYDRSITTLLLPQEY